MDVDWSSSSSSWLVRRKYSDQHTAVSDMRWKNATKRRRSFLFSTSSSSSFVARAIIVVVVVRATEAVTIEEAYFWSTRHAETDPVVDSGGERKRQRESESDNERERAREKQTDWAMKRRRQWWWRRRRNSTARHGRAQQQQWEKL